MTTPEQWRQRRIAKKAYRWALRRGLIRQRPECCERCGQCIANLDAHHPDYYKPLEIRWLCHDCHLIEDIGVRRFDKNFERVPIRSSQFMVAFIPGAQA